MKRKSFQIDHSAKKLLKRSCFYVELKREVRWILNWTLSRMMEYTNTVALPAGTLNTCSYQLFCNTVKTRV